LKAESPLQSMLRAFDRGASSGVQFDHTAASRHSPERRRLCAAARVAVVSMLLLFIGIHNAWDVAVSISVRKKQEP